VVCYLDGHAGLIPAHVNLWTGKQKENGVKYDRRAIYRPFPPP